MLRRAFYIILILLPIYALADVLHIGQVPEEVVLDQMPSFPEDVKLGRFFGSGRAATHQQPSCADTHDKGSDHHTGDH